MSDAQPPAGWYPDPKDPWSERRWDGAAWTEDVRTKAADDANLIEEPTVAFEQRQDDFWEKKDQPSATATGSNNRPKIIVAVIGLVGLAAIVGYLLTRGDQDVSTTATTTTAPLASVASTTPTTEPIITNPSTIAPPTTSVGVASTATPPTKPVPTSAVPTSAAPTNAVLPPALIELPVDAPPFGAVDDANFSPTTRVVRLRGWAMDGDSRAPVKVTLYVDLAEVQSRLADDRRADLAPTYRNGVLHGFEFEFELPPGEHGYCVIAENINGGAEDATIFCETRNV